MNKLKKAAAVICSLSLILCGCEKNTADKTEENKYAAVYEENTVTEATVQTVAEEERDSLPDAYGYRYTDHILIVGDEICGGLLSHALMSDESVISVTGATSDVILRCGNSTQTVEEMVNSTDREYIYLWLGNNDIAQGKGINEYADSILDTAERIRQDNPTSLVVILSPSPQSADKDNGSSMSEYNTAVKNMLSESDYRNIEYLDVFTFLSDADGYLNTMYDSGDGVHLSRAGYRKVLSEIEKQRFYNELGGDSQSSYMYGDIYAHRAAYEVTEGKVAYLTFDDGPSKYTPEILKILRDNNIKATFFITGWCIEGKEDTLKAVADEGHTIALHSWSHDYEEIYASLDAWLEDFSKVYNKVYDITGRKAWAFRFPGGSYNNFNKPTANEIIAEMKRRGFSYYDWNCATSDATTSATYSSCVENLRDSVYANHSVVLMHDSLELTPQYLQDVIDILREEGYTTFETIDTADEVQFKDPNSDD